jgi:hypothetical protein
MPTFQRADKSVNQMADEILHQFATHEPLIAAKVTIDFVFAYPDYDERTGAPKNDALKLHGTKALAIARKIPLKDRALGRADCEITIDHHHWDRATEDVRRALLDHELHHFEVKIDKRGVVTDDLGRPVINLRHHDYDIGWFRIIAQRHGQHSIECQQAETMMEDSGQFFWPAFTRKLKAA